MVHILGEKKLMEQNIKKAGLEIIQITKKYKLSAKDRHQLFVNLAHANKRLMKDLAKLKKGGKIDASKEVRRFIADTKADGDNNEGMQGVREGQDTSGISNTRERKCGVEMQGMHKDEQEETRGISEGDL